MNTAADGLEVDKVHVWRGERHVLKGVSLRLNHSELLHVAGPNGAGKTTLLRVITGLLRPEQGAVSWCGRSIQHTRLDYQAALAYGAHEPALKADLTALENLRFSVGMKAQGERRRAERGPRANRRGRLRRLASPSAIRRSTPPRHHGAHSRHAGLPLAAGRTLCQFGCRRE
jgi:ABC-type transport system involved in cytochrome c biogenesis ATPase subunit